MPTLRHKLDSQLLAHARAQQYPFTKASVVNNNKILRASFERLQKLQIIVVHKHITGNFGTWPKTLYRINTQKADDWLSSHL
jgi:hypothetical protein